MAGKHPTQASEESPRGSLEHRDLWGVLGRDRPVGGSAQGSRYPGTVGHEHVIGPSAGVSPGCSPIAKGSTAYWRQGHPDPQPPHPEELETASFIPRPSTSGSPGQAAQGQAPTGGAALSRSPEQSGHRRTQLCDGSARPRLCCSSFNPDGAALPKGATQANASRGWHRASEGFPPSPWGRPLPQFPPYCLGS